jgi:hypothetical protein
MPDSEDEMPTLARRFEIDLRATATASAGLGNPGPTVSPD